MGAVSTRQRVSTCHIVDRCRRSTRAALVIISFLGSLILSTGCVSDSPGSDATGACATFARLMVDRKDHSVANDETMKRLDLALQKARKAASRDKDFIDLRDKLDALRKSTADLVEYSKLEAEVWKICQPRVGT